MDWPRSVYVKQLFVCLFVCFFATKCELSLLLLCCTYVTVPVRGSDLFKIFDEHQEPSTPVIFILEFPRGSQFLYSAAHASLSVVLIHLYH